MNEKNKTIADDAGFVALANCSAITLGNLDLAAIGMEFASYGLVSIYYLSASVKSPFPRNMKEIPKSNSESPRIAIELPQLAFAASQNAITQTMNPKENQCRAYVCG